MFGSWGINESKDAGQQGAMAGAGVVVSVDECSHHGCVDLSHAGCSEARDRACCGIFVSQRQVVEGSVSAGSLKVKVTG